VIISLNGINQLIIVWEALLVSSEVRTKVLYTSYCVVALCSSEDYTCSHCNNVLVLRVEIWILFPPLIRKPSLSFWETADNSLCYYIWKQWNVMKSRFSQRWWWRMLSSEVWRRVIAYNFTDISEEHTATIFRVESMLSKQAAEWAARGRLG
jgi:hypothetical protein